MNIHTITVNEDSTTQRSGKIPLVPCFLTVVTGGCCCRCTFFLLFDWTRESNFSSSPQSSKKLTAIGGNVTFECTRSFTKNKWSKSRKQDCLEWWRNVLKQEKWSSAKLFIYSVPICIVISVHVKVDWSFTLVCFNWFSDC